jgi:hypothetical protein
MGWRPGILALGLALLAPLSVADAPYRPRSDNDVLEQLRAPRLAGAATLRELRDQWQLRPAHVPSALAYARAALELNRREEDPRYLGYAEAALAPWWSLPQAPPEVVLLRASLRLARMDHALAEQDLRALIDSPAPEGQAARITRAGLRLLQGNPGAAELDCRAAQVFVGPLVAETCSAAVRGLRGEAAQALAALDAALLRSADAPLAAEMWARTVAAELAQRLGRTAPANQHFEQAIRRMTAADSPDPGLLAAYADFLLSQRDARRVQALLTPFPRQDTLVLRLTLAEGLLARQGDAAAQAAAQEHTRHLRLRFQEMRQRGDRSHLRDQALFELDVLGDPPAALRSMAQAWSLQREPLDALLYLRAARAAGAPDAAAAVRRWIAETGLQDLRLAPEVAQ